MFFLLPTKERTKENCRCCDVVRGCESGATVERSETGVANNVCPCGANNRKSGFAKQTGGARCAPPSADPRLKGYSPLRIPNKKSEDSAAKRTQYYCPFLTPPNLPPLLSRGFPRTPAGVRGGPLVKGGCHRKVTGGFRRALPWLPWLVRAAALPCPSRFDCASIGRPVLWPPRIQFAFGCRGRRPRRPGPFADIADLPFLGVGRGALTPPQSRLYLPSNNLLHKSPRALHRDGGAADGHLLENVPALGVNFQLGVDPGFL